MARNPYLITEPACISMSGGRTSAYMLYRILEAHDGKLPKDVYVVFANTGKEMPETLDFVEACSNNWHVAIDWVEARIRRGVGYENKYVYETVVVDYGTASRKGEPFEQMLNARNYPPNPVARYCTNDLKISRIHDFVKQKGLPKNHIEYIGIRADEPRRAAKIHNKVSSGRECFCPLVEDGITARDVGNFWARQNFDLELANNNGVTDWGNCDLCFLKGRGKRQAIIRERPDLANWWIAQEKKLGATFRKDEASYAQMKTIATDQGQLFQFDETSIPCFCGD
jgi:3'-phosphoadenosine 5'-phosphosulfate sulfotransferase (PAPS reductase)/FAD synthetase